MDSTKPRSRRVLRLPNVEDKVGLRRDAIYAGARAGTFPKPIKLTPRSSGWFEDELDAWLEERAASRGAPSRPVSPAASAARSESTISE